MAEQEQCSYLTYSDGEDDYHHSHSKRDKKRDSTDSLRVSYNDDGDEEGCQQRCDSKPSYGSEDDDDDDEEEAVETIALFGADGCTGHHFLRLALDAGYRVRALVAPNTKLEGDFDDLTVIVGTFTDDAKIQEVLYSSTYVVCMVGESVLAKSGDYPRDCLLKFTKTLYRIIQRQKLQQQQDDDNDDVPGIQGFLFQSTSLAANQWGELPAFAHHIRTYWTSRRTVKYLSDLDGVTRFLYSKSWGDKQVSFPFIITRPTSFLRDGRSTKKLQASKSVRFRTGVLYNSYLRGTAS